MIFSKTYKVNVNAYEDGTYYELSDTDEHTVYDVPSGQEFYVRSLILQNTSGSAAKVTIRDGTSGTTKAIVAIDSGDTVILSQLYGMVFTDSLTAESDTAGIRIIVGGLTTNY